MKRRLMTCSEVQVRVLIKVWLFYLQCGKVLTLSLPCKSCSRNDTLPPAIRLFVQMFLLNVTSREGILHQVSTKELYCSLKVQSHCLVVPEFVQFLTAATKTDMWRDKSKVLQFKPNIFQRSSQRPPVMSVKWLWSECCVRNKELGFSRQCVRLKQAAVVWVDPAGVNSHQSPAFWTKQPLSLNISQRAQIHLAGIGEELYSRE